MKTPITLLIPKGVLREAVIVTVSELTKKAHPRRGVLLTIRSNF